MKGMKRTVAILAAQIFFLLFCFVILPGMQYLISRWYFTEKRTYEDTWGISLPDDIECLYTDGKRVGFHGEGCKHTIFQLHSKRLTIQMRGDRNSEIESFCDTICQELETEEDHLPDFEKCYGWMCYEKNQNTLVIIYFSDSRQLHFFENLF